MKHKTLLTLSFTALLAAACAVTRTQAVEESYFTQTVEVIIQDRAVEGQIPFPKADIRSTGQIAVSVIVDRDGKVLSARIDMSRSTIADVPALKAAEEAARKARFNPRKAAPEMQDGTVVYVYQMADSQ